MHNNKHTILLADDHNILRSGIHAMLARKGDIEVVGEVDNGMDAIHKVRELMPDMLITDITMPGMNGTEAIREIKRRDPDIKVIVLTMHSTEQYIHDALNAGADAYVLKEDDFKDLITAIESVFSGKGFLSPGICMNVVSGYLGDAATDKQTSSFDSLTHREREILKLIAEGYKNRDISEYLSITIKTVEKHRSNLMKKLDLHSISALVTYAIKNDIISH
ncbi:MAG: response regulator transcription factor [Gammaproteobacteria bacterium]|jgi:DNA-binding NarL/FixJ family response regulator